MSLDDIKHVLLVRYFSILCPHVTATYTLWQILSGKGGVGKSSVTAQLALSLSLAGHSVGVLDIDLTGPSIPRFFGIESAKVRQSPGGWLPVEVHSSQTLPLPPSPTYPIPTSGVGSIDQNSRSNAGVSDVEEPSTSTERNSEQVGCLQAMSLAFLLASRSTAIVWRGPKKTAMVRQFLSDVQWPPLDYLLIDTPPGTSDEHISVVETLLKKVHNSTDSSAQGLYPSLAGAVIVTTPQAVAVADVRKELNFCTKTGVKVVGVVENMSGYVCPCCGEQSNLFSKGGGQVMAQDFGVPFLGSVPIDQLWGQLIEEGTRPNYAPEELSVNGNELDTATASDMNANAKTQLPLNGTLTNASHKENTQKVLPKDDALLVDKYRSCSLYPVFRDIVRTVVEIIEAGKAVAAEAPISG